MAADSKIEWTHHTFNPWRGCTKVSEGCKNCYADTLSNRNPKVLGVWGPKGTRVVAADAYWREPLKWNAAADAAGERHRVFCASLADVFEGPETMPAEALPMVRAARVRLFDLIRQTPHLDWLLLTKRPQHWRNIIEETLILSQGGNPDDKNYFADHDGDFEKNDLSFWLNAWIGGDAAANVWIGTSVENQPAAQDRIPHLLKIPAAVRFLSCEPLLGPVDLNLLPRPPYFHQSPHGWMSWLAQRLNWVIVGGESGHDARPMHPNWARSLRDQCQAAGVAFFFKQWGEWLPFPNNRDIPAGPPKTPVCLIKPDGKMITPYCQMDAPGHQMARVGKIAAGRALDECTWDEMPRGVKL